MAQTIVCINEDRLLLKVLLRYDLCISEGTFTCTHILRKYACCAITVLNDLEMNK